jgi:hypothetical protein
MKTAQEKAQPSVEMQNFERALRHVISVPKSVVMSEVERLHKPRKKRAKNQPASVPASSDTD